MADDNKTVIEIQAESDGFKAKIGDATEQLVQMGEKGEHSFARMGHTALELNAILELGIKAFEVVKEVFVETIGEAISAAMHEEQSLVSLNLAISNSGYASHEASESMIEFAESMSQGSTFSKDMVMSLEAQAVNLTKTQEAAEKMTQAAIELSSATGRDVKTSMQTLALSMEGVTRGLDKIVPGMKNLSESELRAGGAADLILQKFGGSAQTIMETFSGRVQKMKNSWEELYESVGKAVTQSPMINRAIEGITMLIDKATHAIEEWVKGGGIENLIKGMMSVAQAINTYFIAPMELAYNVGKFLFDGIVLGIQSVIAGLSNVGADIILSLVNPIMEGLKIIGQAVGIFSAEYEAKITGAVMRTQEAINNSVNSFAQSTTDVMKDAATKVSEDASKMFDFSFSDKLSKRLEEINVFFEGAKAPNEGLRTDLKKTEMAVLDVGGAFSRVYQGMNTQAQDLAKNAGKNFETLGKTMFNSIGSGAANAFAAFGKALATGKNALKAFTDSLLATLGGMAVQIGSQFILQGAAYTWAGMPNGPALMSAGAALAAFGGILSGLGGGGESASDTGGGGGGGGPATGIAGGGGEPAQSAAPVKESKASIIINGDFLNSRETANHLSEILRQNSDITDYTITAQGRSYA